MKAGARILSAGGALLALVLGMGVAGLSSPGGVPALAVEAPGAGESAGRWAPTAGSWPAGAGPAARGEAGADTVVVESIDRLAFRPDSVTIDVGDAVRWENAGIVRHTATADPAQATLENSVELPDGAEPFDSGLMAEGETFTHVFRMPGRYRYFCIPHEGAQMVGVIVVAE